MQKAPTPKSEGQLYTPRDSNPEPADYGFGAEPGPLAEDALPGLVPDTVNALFRYWETRPANIGIS